MRVAHVIAYFAPAFRYGGPPRSVYALCEALTAAGVHVEVFTTTADGDRELPAADRSTSGAPFRVHYFPRVGPRRLYMATALSRSLRDRVREFDVVHIHGLWNATVMAAARIARSAGVPYAISPRGMLEAGAVAHNRRRKAVLYTLAQRRHLARAAFLHATAASEADTLAALKLGPRTVVVPNGVTLRDPAARHAAGGRAALGVPEHAPLVLALGRLHPIKRLDLLAAAFARVRESRPDARLVVAGPDETGLRASVEGWLGPHAAHTTFTGQLDAAAVQQWLDAADVLVQCSDSESFGMSVAEALAAGVPVVVSRTCPWEIAEREGCGFWVPQEADAIGRAIAAIINDRHAAAVMGQRGRAVVHRQFSWPSVAARLAAEYAAATGRRPWTVVADGAERHPPHV